MQHSNFTDNQNIEGSGVYPCAGFAGDEATVHAHRAAKLISEYLKLNSTAKARLQEFIKKMLYYKSYDLTDLSTAIVVVQKLGQSPHFNDFTDGMEFATSTGACGFNNAEGISLLLFTGAYSLAEGSKLHVVWPGEYACKLALDTRAFTQREIYLMADKLYDWFNWKLDISSAELDTIKATITSK